MNSCGTLKVNTKYMPIMDQKLNKGAFEHYGNHSLMTHKWQIDGRLECCRAGKIDCANGGEISKPRCMIDYNQNMGTLDKTYTMVCGTETVRKIIQ
ncbi:hypothetical protein JTB14_029382 [Gonioctena quinquepunctata]|nr:hypothetical protein JTB14_029382 [Gonioctena quinquepunctata]